jgi:hypothetical protein
MTNSPFRQAQGDRPLTFEARGVAVPFTTPALFGARARSAPRQPELLMSSPSGGRGFYVLPWDQACVTYRPTVHDRSLIRTLQAFPELTPDGVRSAARDVAVQGLAGREARSAAVKAIAAERDARATMHCRLLNALADVARKLGFDDGGPIGVQLAATEDEARRLAIDAAPYLDLAPDSMMAGMERLVAVFVDIGLGGPSEPARVSALLVNVMQLHEETMAWGRAHHDRAGELALLVGAAAEVTARITLRALRYIRAWPTDLPALLRHWAVCPAQVIRQAARPGWLLDGWEQVCLVWRNAETPDARPAALVEMAPLVPVLPEEATAWAGAPTIDSGPLQSRRAMQLTRDRRPGFPLSDLLLRNEQFRACSP